MKSSIRPFVATLALAAAGSAFAQPVIDPTPSGSGVNVLSWGLDGTVSDPWPTLTGSLNTNDFYANFQGSAPLQYQAGGQAVIEGVSGDFSAFQVTADKLGPPVESLSFFKLVLQIDASVDSRAVINVDGTNFGLFDLNDKGSNWFTITSLTPMTTVSFATFATSCTLLTGCTPLDAIHEITQVRFDNVTPVPEPQAYALMLAGAGVLSLVAMRRRRQGR